MKSRFSILEQRKLTWSEAKGILETYLTNLNLDIHYGIIEECMDNQELPSFTHPTRRVSILCNNQRLGYFTKLHPNICKTFGTDIYVFEINLNLILLNTKSRQNVSKLFSVYSQYPLVTQDISLIVPFHISVQDIIESIKQQNFELVEDIEVCDQYQGQSMQSGYHSIGLRLSYRSMSHTLKSNEVEERKNQILNYVQTIFPIQLRE